MEQHTEFYKRHIGLTQAAITEMLAAVGANSLEDLCDKAIPENIRLKTDLSLPVALCESEALEQMAAIIDKNKLHKSFIGQGYHGTFVPSVILRNLFENPAWYTAYTPYQAEISQGRLELLFNFQTLVSELTGLPVANASLLDEGTAIAEACALAVRFFKRKRKKIALAGSLHPQSLAVLSTRADSQQYKLEKLSLTSDELNEDYAALLVPLLDTFGVINDYQHLIAQAKTFNVQVIFVADPLALCLLKPVELCGADIAVGSMQRFGVPMGFGGPHAAYIATREELTRLIPGRIVGLSVDSQGRPAYRLALQTREQHIRRDKATSNICTSQVLLANMAAAFAIWHGGAGLQAIAQRVHGLACLFATSCREAGVEILGQKFFDCVTLVVTGQAAALKHKAYQSGMLLRALGDDLLVINFDELSTLGDLEALCSLLNVPMAKASGASSGLASEDLRMTPFLPQKAFTDVSSETDMLRLLTKLSDKDLALDRSMIPLGSCTMKLNAAAELQALSNPKFVQIHPFAPTSDSLGYAQLVAELESYLCAITGFVKISFQPNSGAQGEYAGLLTIRRYLEHIGQSARDICLIPASAHGTNPASANMAGMDVVVVKCSANGDIDLADLEEKANSYSARLAALMITYPSTHGVYEEQVVKICEVIHKHGGQVYFDGANLNALVGLARPADIGADVCHINLHKTFAIPHGGGGPGMGPIGVAQHLTPFLPSGDAKEGSVTVSSAPYGSASILAISWMYIRLMGSIGLKKATQCAILSANYVAKTLEKDGYTVLYKGKNELVAHECILDIRLLKNSFNIGVEDVAKRLIDYSFHAPTMSFPVAGTLMIEPTESESLPELKRFCKAMGEIYQEAHNVAKGVWPIDDNPLVNAPHTLEEALCGDWKHSYSREVACFPVAVENRSSKYFAPVSRIDNVAGDRNLICSCPAISEYEDGNEL